MPATVLFLECKSYVIVGIYASVSGFLLMCGDVQFSGTLYVVSSHRIFGHWKAVTAIFLTLTLIYRTLWKKNFNI